MSGGPSWAQSPSFFQAPKDQAPRAFQLFNTIMRNLTGVEYLYLGVTNLAVSSLSPWFGAFIPKHFKGTSGRISWVMVGQHPSNVEVEPWALRQILSWP